jgi:hypothetical protein
MCRCVCVLDGVVWNCGCSFQSTSFFSSIENGRIAFCVWTRGEEPFEVNERATTGFLFFFCVVVGVCESILGNHNISYVRAFFLVFWYVASDGVSSPQANTYKCWLARLPAAPPAPLNLCCSFWYLMGDWMALRKSRCDWRICLIVSTHSLVASGLGA